LFQATQAYLLASPPLSLLLIAPAHTIYTRDLVSRNISRLDSWTIYSPRQPGCLWVV